MKEFKGVTGSSNQPLYVGKTTVYIRSNIESYQELDEEGNVIFEGYKYDEIQMSKDDFIHQLKSDKDLLKQENDVLLEYCLELDSKLLMLEIMGGGF